jgi:formate dehydrogenase subunit gamma
MSATGTKARPAPRIMRFDRVQRGAHWANAFLFGILMLTAIPLYFGPVAGIAVPRHLVAVVHLWAGIALPVPLILSLIGPWGARMRRDVRRVNLWTRGELRWLRALGSEPTVLDKFNPGQKLNAIFTGGTLVHDILAFVVFFVVFGHIAFALTHRDSMRSMIKGWVTESWAARHAAGWLKEERAAADQAQPES